MSNELRTFAYICPECLGRWSSPSGSFALAAGDCEIPCPCGKSTLRVENMGSMYHLSVPLCGLAAATRGLLSPGGPAATGRRWP